MQKLLGQLARRLGLYGPMRIARMRMDRMKPSQIKLRRDMVAFYRQFCAPGELVFDVGANLGSRCEIFLELGARVIAVEPQPICQDVLRKLMGRNPRFILEPTAVGAQPGNATMYVATSSVLSTMSQDWIDKTSKTGRFGEESWQKKITVPVTTMDQLIARHGKPRFCKVDVEGFEVQVFRGLSTPIQAISFELVTEAADNAAMCIDRLESLGRYEYNYSNAESMTWERPAWVAAQDMKRIIQSELPPLYFGDVYARLA